MPSQRVQLCNGRISWLAGRASTHETCTGAQVDEPCAVESADPSTLAQSPKARDAGSEAFVDDRQRISPVA